MKDIVKGNKVIVDFMGYEYVGKNIMLHSSKGTDQIPNIDGYVHRDDLIEALTFEYYQDMLIAGKVKLKNTYGISQTIKTGLEVGWYYLAICNRGTKLKYLRKNLKYHTDIVMLMEVVEKIAGIEKVSNFNINITGDAMIELENGSSVGSYYERCEQSNILMIWDVCVRFLERYV